MNDHSRIFYYLLVIILVANFIPLGFLSFSNLVEPLDQIYIISFFPLIFYNKFKLFRNKYIRRIFILYSFYFLLKFVIQNYVKGNEEIFPVFKVFNIVMLLYLFANISNDLLRYRLLKVYMFLLLFSTIFGFFTFYVGEPFATLRLLLADDPEWIFFGRGDRLIGLDRTIFEFGYNLSVLPILLFMFYKLTKKSFYLVFIIISVIALILNGERAGLLFSGIVLIYLTFHWFRNYKSALALLITILISTFLFQFTQNTELRDDAISRLTETEYSDNYYRIAKQFIGLNIVLNNPLSGGTIDEYEILFSREAGFTPTSIHNTYINVGRYTGFLGWILLILFFHNFFKILKTISVRYKLEIKNRIIFIGFTASLVTLLSVGLLHNAGIFTGEKNTWLLIGFLISMYLKKASPQVSFDHLIND